MNTNKKHYSLKDLEKKQGRLTMGRFLQSWRLSEGLNQKQFAKKLGMSSANLCDIEKERKGISAEKAHEIALKIGYSPTVLIRMALEEQLANAGFDYHIEIRAAA